MAKADLLKPREKDLPFAFQSRIVYWIYPRMELEPFHLDSERSEYEYSSDDDSEVADEADYGLLASVDYYDEKDAEADQIWQHVDAVMRSRRKNKHHVKSGHEQSNATIAAAEHFAGMKNELLDIPEEEWERIPDSKVLRGKRSRSQRPSFPCSGFTVARLSRVSNSRDTVMEMLPKAIIRANPEKPLCWIAAASLEEAVGKIKAARRLINKGCIKFGSYNDNVWLEACRLARPEEAKAVVARGVRHLPYSVELWMKAMSLEHDVSNKRKVLEKALDRMPDCERFQKALMELPKEETAL